MAEADREKRLITSLYRNDIDRCAGAAAPRARAVFDAIPGLLSKRVGAEYVLYPGIVEVDWPRVSLPLYMAHCL